MATGRRQFNDTEDEASAHAPVKAQHSCAANECPMPGSIFPGGAREGVCAWHYGVNAGEWRRVTQILRDWECVTAEINSGRRALTGIGACDPRFQDQRFRAAVSRLRPSVAAGGWGNVFDEKPGEHYEQWVRRLEQFVGDIVHKSLSREPQLQ